MLLVSQPKITGASPVESSQMRLNMVTSGESQGLAMKKRKKRQWDIDKHLFNLTQKGS